MSEKNHKEKVKRPTNGNETDSRRGTGYLKEEKTILIGFFRLGFINHRFIGCVTVASTDNIIILSIYERLSPKAPSRQ